MRLLILGGTTEGSALARALAGRRDLVPLLSLAGRTEQPASSPIPVRVGGFGGVDGLTRVLNDAAIGAVVDATHPFAARISAHAGAACGRARVPLARFSRPPWRPAPGDAWVPVADLDAAAAALGSRPRRVFLTTGRLGLASFRGAPQHFYLIRTIDPPAEDVLPPRRAVVLARGPFDMAAEEALMRRERIEILVSKNSGGTAAAAKLAAARALGLPVVMVERPPTAEAGATFEHLEGVLDWIEAHRVTSSAGAGSERLDP